MDLKDVVKNTKDKAEEAHSAFHAGHHDVAEQYLAGIRAQIVEYERAPEQRTEDVTKSATSEKPDEVSKETPAKALGAPAQPVSTAAAAAALGSVNAQEPSKPTQ
ncbi:hypothetical protein ES703_17174 [subsurface metagenome]